ncbi:RNA-guided endonuclease TnpB family protein, partial [Ligilactobacillus equi]|uniref:RNA-guided endonuclease TnpB family protein n=1 Tax=Ligilactobacillus equi TaxID=137357 RepID=UPI0007051BBC
MPQVELPYMMGLKLRMYPNHKQEQVAWKNINASRFIYNQLLANSWIDSAIKRNKLDKKYPIPTTYWRYKFSKDKKIKKPIKASQVRPTGLARIKGNSRYPWLNDSELDSDMFTNTEVHYRNAWKMFRKVHSAGTPKFKKKSQPVQSYSTSNHYSSSQVKAKGGVPSLYNGSIHFIDSQYLQLPKLGKVKIKLHRTLPTNQMVRIATVTIKHYPSGKWFVSLLLKSDQPFNSKFPKVDCEVGFDLNTENFLTQSDGKVVSSPRYYRTIKDKLAKEQRILSRRQRRAKKEGRPLKTSKNYQKQKLIVAKLHEKVRNQRTDFLHKISIALIKNHDLVVAENLKSKNMLKNHALAMSISDVGWRTLLTFLEYKAPKYGRTFVEVNPAYTTQTCNDCGFRMGTEETKKLTLKDRAWTCPKCKVFHIRD